MARITVEDCIDKFESRFELVLVASNRARKLHAGESPTVEIDNDKNTVIALREIAEETIAIDQMKNNLVEEYQTVSALDEEELTLEYSENEENQDVENTENTNQSSIAKKDESPEINVDEANKEESSIAKQDESPEINVDEENKFDIKDQDLNSENNIS